MAPVLLNPSRFGGGGGGAVGYDAAVLLNSPIVYYPQSDASGSTMTDSSGNTRNATYVNSPTLGVASILPTDTATDATYNGTNQYGVVASGAAADVALKAITRDFTLEAWIKPTSVSGNRGILDRYGNGAAGVSAWAWYMAGNIPRFVIRNSSDVDATLNASTALVVGTRYHIAATYDGTNLKAYLNGVLDGTFASNSIAGMHARSPLLNVAQIPVLSGFLAATVSKVAIYGTALSAADLAAHIAAA